MPIEAPRLDDLSYDRVVADLVRRIPVYAPTWTDFNDSDPGITLIQLFGQLAEQLGYRLNRVPELAHIELLKLLGVRLQPAHAARTRLALLLSDPTVLHGYALPLPTAAKARSGTPPPRFEVDGLLDVVPAEVRLLLTTRNPYLNDVLLTSVAPPAHETPPADLPRMPVEDSDWLSLRWDGKKPKAKDLPTDPLQLLPDRPHRYLWLGVLYNDARDAGFRGARVTLTLQFDDDEQPTLSSIGPCQVPAIAGESPTAVDWLWYWDTAAQALKPVPGRIDDLTGHLARSGGIRFTVPDTIGPIADWAPMRAAGTLSPLDACLAFGRTLGDELGAPSAVQAILAEIGENYKTVVKTGLDASFAALGQPPPLTEVFDKLKQRLQADLLTVLTPPPPGTLVDQVKQHYLDQVANTLSALTNIPCQVQQVFTTFGNTVLGFVTGGLGGLGLPGNWGSLTPAGQHNFFVTSIQGMLGGFDPCNSLSAAQISAVNGAFLAVLNKALTDFQPLIPPVLATTIPAFFHGLASGVVDAAWASLAGIVPLDALRDWYKTQALSSIDAAFAAPPPAAVTVLADAYSDAIAKATDAVTAAGALVVAPVVHPLAQKYRGTDKVRGWLRLTLPDDRVADTALRLRHAGFNVVPALNAETAPREVLGRSDGRPSQAFTLRHRNVLAGTLELAVQEDVDPTAPLTPWSETLDLAAAGPFDRVFSLDREAGLITFGDGLRGRIPPLVTDGGYIVASTYRFGGGLAGEVPVGAIQTLDTPRTGVANAVNLVAATGGRDAETLEQAEERARKELSTRSRAVTADDFQWIAGQTPEVRVGRVVVVPLRRPLPAVANPPAPPTPLCGPALPAGPTGLDTIVAAGVVTVVVVPDQAVPEPLPAPSFLRAVCAWLDLHRLVTTEIHVVPPQYARLCHFTISVRARPGTTRAMLQERIEARLGEYLHPLHGGDDGTGFPFGGQVHVADLMAQVYRVEGVDRVENLSCAFTRTRSNAVPRQGRLVLCPDAADEFDRIALGPEECVSVDVASTQVSTVA